MFFQHNSIWQVEKYFEWEQKLKAGFQDLELHVAPEWLGLWIIKLYNSKSISDWKWAV